jgi:hypothetical protein
MRGKPEQVIKPVTLADLKRDGKFAWVYCKDCGRERDIPPAELGLPLETPVPAAGKRLKCSVCGGKKVSVKPELYPGGIEAAPPPIPPATSCLGASPTPARDQPRHRRAGVRETCTTRDIGSAGHSAMRKALTS